MWHKYRDYQGTMPICIVDLNGKFVQYCTPPLQNTRSFESTYNKSSREHKKDKLKAGIITLEIVL